jgi:hypothetical protein
MSAPAAPLPLSSKGVVHPAGLRIGDALGLRREDIDAASHVGSATSRINNRLACEGPDLGHLGHILGARLKSAC